MKNILKIDFCETKVGFFMSECANILIVLVEVFDVARDI